MHQKWNTLTRKVVDVNNVKDISRPMLANHVNIEQLQTLKSENAEHGITSRHMAQYSGKNNGTNFTSRLRSSLESLSSKGWGGSSATRMPD